MTDEKLIAALRVLFNTPIEKVDANTLAIIARRAADRLSELSPSRLSSNDEGVTDEMVARSLAAFNEAINNPIIVPCERCDGRGYHHGFGEDGHDPDWCEDCGGGQFSVVPGEEERAIRAALEAVIPTQPPTPASGEQMEVVAWRNWSDTHDQWSLAFGRADDRPDHQALVTLDAAWKALTAANERAERAEKALAEAHDIAERYREMYCQKSNEKVDEFRRAETAEALNTTLSEGIAVLSSIASRADLMNELDTDIANAIHEVLAALPAKQGEPTDEA